MSFFAGLAGGISEGAIRTQKENAAQQEAAVKRQTELLSALATSPNLDPETRTQAVAGLLELAQPSKRKKGIRAGMLGEYEQSPYVGMLQQLIARNVGPQAPAVQPTSRPAGPPGGAVAVPGSAALPSSSPVQGGPPMRMPATPPQGPSPTGAEDFPESGTSPAIAAPPMGPQPPTRMEGDRPVFSAPPSVAADQFQQPSVAAPNSVASVAPPVRGVLPPLASPNEQKAWDRSYDVDAEVEAVHRNALAMGASPEEARQMALQAVAGRSGYLTPESSQIREFEDLNGQRVTGIFHPRSNVVTDLDGRVRTDLRPISIARTNANNPIYQIANELFNKEPHNLTPAESGLVDQEVRRRAVLQTGQGAYARGTAQTSVLQQRPLTPEVASTQGVPIGTTPATLSGQVPRTAQMQQREQGVKETLGQLDAYAAMIEKVVPDRAGFAARFQNSAQNLLAYYQANPEYNALLTMRLELQNAIARSRDVGNLSQFEQEAADKVIGEINQGLLSGTDTKEVLLAKLGAVRQRLERVQQLNAPLSPQGAPQAGGQPPPFRGMNAQIVNDPNADHGPWTVRGQTYQWGQPITYAGQPMYVIGVNPQTGNLRLTDQPPPR